VPHLCRFYSGICLTTEEKAWKSLSQGSLKCFQWPSHLFSATVFWILILLSPPVTQRYQITSSCCYFLKMESATTFTISIQLLWKLYAAAAAEWPQPTVWCYGSCMQQVTCFAAPYSPGVLLYLIVLHAPIQNIEGNYKYWS